MRRGCCDHVREVSRLSEPNASRLSEPNAGHNDLKPHGYVTRQIIRQYAGELPSEYHFVCDGAPWLTVSDDTPMTPVSQRSTDDLDRRSDLRALHCCGPAKRTDAMVEAKEELVRNTSLNEYVNANGEVLFEREKETDEEVDDLPGRRVLEDRILASEFIYPDGKSCFSLAIAVIVYACVVMLLGGRALAALSAGSHCSNFMKLAMLNVKVDQEKCAQRFGKHSDAKRASFILSMGCAMMALIAGILVPLRNYWLQQHDVVRWFVSVTHATRGYLDDEHRRALKSYRRFLARAARFWWLSPVSGLCAVVSQVTVLRQEESGHDHVPLGYVRTLSSILWLLSTLLLNAGAVETICLESSMHLVLLLQLGIDQPDPDWGLLCRQTLVLRSMLAKLWDVRVVGCLVIFRTTVLLTASVVLWTRSIQVSSEHFLLEIMLKFSGVACASGAICVLWPLSTVSALGSDSTTLVESVVFKVQQCFGTEVGSSQQFQSFAMLMNAQPIRLEISGVPVTRQLLISIFMNVMVYLPAVFTILHSTMFDKTPLQEF